MGGAVLSVQTILQCLDQSIFYFQATSLILHGRCHSLTCAYACNYSETRKRGTKNHKSPNIQQWPRTPHLPLGLSPRVICLTVFCLILKQRVPRFQTVRIISVHKAIPPLGVVHEVRIVLLNSFSYRRFRLSGLCSPGCPTTATRMPSPASRPTRISDRTSRHTSLGFR